MEAFFGEIKPLLAHKNTKLVVFFDIKLSGRPTWKNGADLIRANDYCGLISRGDHNY